MKKARCNDILGLQLSQQEAWYRTLHGREYEILVEGLSKNNDQRICGRSIGNLNVLVDRFTAQGRDLLDARGQLLRVRIHDNTNLSLYAKAVDDHA